MFGHLVSDESLDELHAFARRTGLPPRAFDHDHYDVPVSRYDELIAAGAVPLNERELARRLPFLGVLLKTDEEVVRAFLPDAAQVEAVNDDGTGSVLEKIHDAGLFAGPAPPRAARSQSPRSS